MIIVLGIAALTMLIGWPSMQRTIQKTKSVSFGRPFVKHGRQLRYDQRPVTSQPMFFT
ncbi:hypothetical protein [Limosilactobacillus mucosae]|uniref:hypothetical protein n=1 Tax=Limosilactobacillus mucosae TaxID=97478 RepID=UPI0039BFD042